MIQADPKSVGVDDDRARRAAEDVAYDRLRIPGCENALGTLKRDVGVLEWMVGLNILINVAILVRLLA